jgi:hypothetical protein
LRSRERWEVPMVSFEMRQTLKTAIGVLVLAAVAEPYSGFSQPAPEPGTTDDGEGLTDLRIQTLTRIQETQAQDGLNSAELIEPLTALGLLYQEDGDHNLAVAAFEQARHIVRVNYGLSALDEVRPLQQLVRAENARGNVTEAWGLEQQLLALLRQHPDELQTARVLHEIADRRMDILNRYSAGEWPPEIILGCYYNQGGPRTAREGASNCTSGSRGIVKQRLASEAHRYYAQAINVLLRNEQFGSDELPALLTELAQSSYQYGGGRLARRSFRFLLAYQATNSEPWPTRIDTLVQIADVTLLHASSRDSNESALETYEQAYELLEVNGIAQASIERIFSPEMPIMLPSFAANPLASDQTRESAGYIDVAFEITRYGRGRKVEILGATPNVTRAAKRSLAQLILRSRFRPRVTSGQFADSSPIAVRYFLNE